MIITHHGHNTLKITFSDVTIAIDPTSQDFFKSSKWKSDIVLATELSEKAHGIETVTYNGEEPFVIDGPGSYDVDGLHVEGFLCKSTNKHLITSYIVEVDGITVGILGNASSKSDIPDGFLEQSTHLDVLVLSVSGDDVDSHQAYTTAVALGIATIIPTGYIKKEDAHLQAFLAECPQEAIATVDKLTLKKRDLPEKLSVIVFEN